MSTSDYMSLERIIKNFNNNPTEANASLLQERMQEASYLVLLKKDSLEGMVEKPAMDITRLPALTINTHSEAGIILPVFTNKKEAERYEDGMASAAANIPFTMLYSLLKSNPQIQSLIINPEGDAIAFDAKQFLSFFAKAQSESHQEEIEEGSVITTDNRIDMAGEEAFYALAREASHFDEIEAIWVARQLDHGKFTRWFFVVDSPLKSENRYQSLMIRFLSNLDKNLPTQAALVYADEEAGAGIAEKMEPVYRKQASLH